MRTPVVPARALARAALALGTAGAITLLTVGVASAHVTADPDTAEKGGYGTITFRVPNESETAGTVKLQLTLPAEHPISSVRTMPVPGWTAETADDPATGAVRTVTWTSDPGTRIGPGEFVEFRTSMGRLPSDVDTLVLPVVQTYDDGTVVRWDQPPVDGAAEPEHPAPVVRLVDAAAAPTGGASSSDGTARLLGGAGMLLGALGLGVGIGAAVRTRTLARTFR